MNAQAAVAAVVAATAAHGICGGYWGGGGRQQQRPRRQKQPRKSREAGDATNHHQHDHACMAPHPVELLLGAQAVGGKEVHDVEDL